MAKRIYVVRHAKSSWLDMRLSDKERPLNPRGKADAPRMANWCLKQGYVPDQIITSTAVRAQTTAELFRQGLQMEIEQFSTNDSLYHAPEDEYITACYGLGEEVSSVMLFGHNPGITYLANLVAASYVDNVPTCGILVIDSSADSWQEIGFENCRLIQMQSPKTL